MKPSHDFDPYQLFDIIEPPPVLKHRRKRKTPANIIQPPSNHQQDENTFIHFEMVGHRSRQLNRPIGSSRLP